jgi:hypothetical protein
MDFLAPDIVTRARLVIDDKLISMSPGGDISPMLFTQGRYGLNATGINFSETPEGAEHAMASIVAYIVGSAATEVVFAASAWTAPHTHAPDGTPMNPRDNPERAEVLMLTYTDQYGSEIHSAPIIRRNNQPPVAGAWEPSSSEKGLSGHLGESIEMGCFLAADLENPEFAELRSQLDQKWEAGDLESLVEIAEQMVEHFEKSDVRHRVRRAYDQS